MACGHWVLDDKDWWEIDEKGKGKYVNHIIVILLRCIRTRQWKRFMFQDEGFNNVKHDMAHGVMIIDYNTVLGMELITYYQGWLYELLYRGSKALKRHFLHIKCMQIISSRICKLCTCVLYSDFTAVFRKCFTWMPACTILSLGDSICY